MGQKHKRFRSRNFGRHFACATSAKILAVRACAAGDGAICSKHRKIVPHYGANPNPRNGARLRSPSVIMANFGIGIEMELVFVFVLFIHSVIQNISRFLTG